jgi:hypothetical protein
MKFRVPTELHRKWGAGHPAIRWRIGVYRRTVFFLDVFVNNDRARHV